jgi:hypothetical protein
MKKKEKANVWAAEQPPEPLPTYTESNAANKPLPPAGGAAPEMTTVPKSAMKKVAPVAPLLDLHASGSSTPTKLPGTKERRRSYVVDGNPEPFVLSIYEPANRSSQTLGGTAPETYSPILAPAPPPKSHRKSAASSRPRRKSNLAPVSEEEPESSDSRLASLGGRSGSSQSPPDTPRTPRTAAFHALTGDPPSGQPSPMSASFNLGPMPPLPPGNISPVSSNYSDHDVGHMR